VRHADAHRVAQLPADAARVLVVPLGIVAVDDDRTRAVTDTVDFQLDGQVRAQAEEAGNLFLEVAIAKGHAVLARDRDALGPAQRGTSRSGDPPFGMRCQIGPAARHQLGDGAGSVDEKVPDGPEVMPVPVGVNPSQRSFRLLDEGPTGMPIQVAVVALAPRREVQWLPGGELASRLDVAFL